PQAMSPLINCDCHSLKNLEDEYTMNIHELHIPLTRQIEHVLPTNNTPFTIKTDTLSNKLYLCHVILDY
ncbi:MAG: hypothetical protein WBP00_09410, partial [Saprospiraceae bacterium]